MSTNPNAEGRKKKGKKTNGRPGQQFGVATNDNPLWGEPDAFVEDNEPVATKPQTSEEKVGFKSTQQHRADKSPQRQPASAAGSHSINTSDHIVYMVVDSEWETSIKVHKGLLCQNSEYFTTNIVLERISNTKIDLDCINFQSKKIAIDVVKNYAQWLYTGTIPTVAATNQLDEEKAVMTLNFLARAYIFGEVIKDIRWLDVVMDRFIYVHITAGQFGLSSIIRLVYRDTVLESPMRKLLVDMNAYNLSETVDSVIKFKDLPNQFLLDVLAAMVMIRLAKQEDWVEHLQQNMYHQKDAGDGQG